MLFAERGTELKIAPLLEGIRTLSGEKIQWYLAAELRDRIRSSGVRITVIDKLARKQYAVEPRQFDGRLLHQLPDVRTPFGEVYAELYLREPDRSSQVGLYRAGTRVVENIATLAGLERAPWTSGYLQGLLDAPFLNLTPGTRSGLVHDERFAALLDGLQPLERHLQQLIDDQRRAEEEQASRELLRTIQRAFREAMLALPPEEYDWFDIQARSRQGLGVRSGSSGASGAETEAQQDALGAPEPELRGERQREFFEHAGPLFSVLISPAASTVAVNESRAFTALPRDRSRRRVEHDLEFHWQIADGGGTLGSERDQEVAFTAPGTPGLTQLRVTVRQRDVECTAGALVTITDSLAPAAAPGAVNARGLPGYTFERAAGELWRSRFDAERNLIIVNSGHRDFVFAARNQALKVRYLVRLYIKELVLQNFGGLPTDQVLERMVELSLYTEEKL
jgi:hypothetical protein